MRVRRWLPISLIALLLAGLLGLASGPAAAAPATDPAAGHEHAPPGWPAFPADDPFYKPPKGFENTAPGSILRKRRITPKAYGIPVPVRTWQLLVRSTDAHGRPVSVVSTVILPLIPPKDGQAKLFSYQIATDSLGSQCNPSYGLRVGLEKDTTGLFLPLASGWASVMTDYQGPDMQWTVGPMAGQATLDGIRAAEQLGADGIDTHTPVGVWGYSGGGQATAWAAQLQPRYAPELNVRGFVAGAFPGDLKKTLRGVNGGPFSGFAFGGVAGQLRAHPELRRLLTPEGKRELGRISQRCQLELLAMEPFKDIGKYAKTDLFTDPEVNRVMAESSTGKLTPTAPVLIQQSALDEIIRPEYNQGTYRQWCARGADVEYHLSLIPEHVVYDFGSIPQMWSWMQDRFAGKPTHGCTAR
ncbi:lipase family protein [Sciscionella marina]|uniref:lipase family protein n=1 Tax=Sciscionella marina TaxID=508770 RepID=UPI0003627A44|nr:lipase family protein [Sciscionella marina]